MSLEFWEAQLSLEFLEAELSLEFWEAQLSLEFWEAQLSLEFWEELLRDRPGPERALHFSPASCVMGPHGLESGIKLFVKKYET